MTTTKDDALAAACAKTILDKANDAMKNTKKEEEPVGQVRFAIQVDNVYTGNVQNNYNKEEPVIITLEDQEEQQLKAEKSQLKDEDSELKKKVSKSQPINPATGLPYIISYEGVNAYEGGSDEEVD